MSNVGKILSLFAVNWTIGNTHKINHFKIVKTGPCEYFKLVFHTLAFIKKLP